MENFVPEFSPNKLDELIIYISRRNFDDFNFGMSKLHKQLWMSDFHYFGLTGHVLIGATYVRRQYGPFCAQLEQALARLEDLGRLKMGIVERFNYQQRRPIALHGCDYELFCAEEIAAVEDVLWETRNMSSVEISNRSVLHPAWLCADDDAELSYGFAFAPSDEPFEAPIPLPWNDEQGAGD